jgi:hypothetical protein
MAISLKSLIIISILLSAGLIFGTQCLSDTIGDANKSPDQNFSPNFPIIDQSSSDQVSFRKKSLEEIDETGQQIAPSQNSISNSPVSVEDKSPEQHFMNLVANLVVSLITQDTNDLTGSNTDTNNSNEISQNNSKVSSLNFAISETNGSDYYELLKEAPMTDEQLEEIHQYSGGKSPTEIVDEFCAEVRSGELHLMAEDIRQSYNYNPASPAILMSVFEKMGNLCP